MTNRWIVGVDGSPGSRAALDWAIAHARRRNAEITIARTYRQAVATRAVGVVMHRGDAEPTAADIAGHELEIAVAEVDSPSPLDRLVVEGRPGPALVDAAKDRSLLVVGRHGADTGWQHVLGSVSRYCVTHSPIPTVVVPTSWDHGPTERIIVGFDGSDHSVAALHWAFEFAEPATTITALIALEVAPWLRSDIIEERLGQELKAEDDRLRALIDAADPDGRAHRDTVVRGARPALARAAEHADLVVLGTHGSGRVANALLGSVSTWMLDATDHPTVIVPRSQ